MTDDEIRRWWSAEYPAITDVSGVNDKIIAAAYDLVASFTLPSETWWDDYYGPLEHRIPEFLDENPGNESAAGVAAAAQEEIAMFRRHGDAYSYGFFIVIPAG